MVGYPKFLNTKEDYEYVRANFPREQWEPDFKALLNERYEWFNLGEIEDEGVTDDTHKVVEDKRDDETVVRYQYEYKENENARIYRLGYTVEEVEAILNA